MALPVGNYEVSVKKSSEDTALEVVNSNTFDNFTGGEYFSVNESTISMITRLLFQETGRIYHTVQEILSNKKTYQQLRRVIVEIAEDIEEIVVNAVQETKAIVFDNPAIRLSRKELHVIQKLISALCIAVSLFIYQSLKTIKEILDKFTRSMGQDPLFCGFLHLTAIQSGKNDQ